MRGENHLLAITTSTDEVTGEVKPLLSFPVQVCPATSSTDVKFEIAGPSGAPRKQMYTDSGTGEIITDDQCQRGVRVGDEFKPIPQEKIRQITAATKISTMVALGSIDLKEIPFERVTGRYFLQSPVKGGAPRVYKLIYEAMLREKKGLITKRTARSRQKLAVIYADPNAECLVMLELVFAGQLVKPDGEILAFHHATVETKQLQAARKVIGAVIPSTGRNVLDAEYDEAITLKQELIEAALTGESLTPPTPMVDVVAGGDLMAQLEASLEAVAG